MHELGIVFHVIDSVEKVGKDHQLATVSKVVLEVGEVSGILGDYLKDCWRWAADRSELLKGADLQIETIEAVTYCEDCQKTYGTVEHGRICPFCQSEHTYLVSGNECTIKEIEVC